MPGRKHNTGTYFIFDRLYYLMQAQKFDPLNYKNEFEISKHTFYRDLEHLRDFYDVEFVYNYQLKIYERLPECRL